MDWILLLEAFAWATLILMLTVLVMAYVGIAWQAIMNNKWYGFVMVIVFVLSVLTYLFYEVLRRS